MKKITDAHTHIFPEALAQKAVTFTGDYYGLHMSRKGTLEDLTDQGDKFGVEAYLVCSTATKPTQVCAVNDFLALCCAHNPALIGFGTLHPDMERAEDEVERIISLGLSGVKLHSDFQDFIIDEKKPMGLYEMLEGRLPILFHMGDQNTSRSKPQSLAAVCRRFPCLTVIGAHLGGYGEWDSAQKHLSELGIYVDTSSSLAFMTPQRALEQIRSFGAERCLFGTDYPMWDLEAELSRFNKLELSEKERELILHNNFDALFRKDTII